jgi:hypothetical protein
MVANPLQHAQWPVLHELGAEWQRVVEEAIDFSATPPGAAEVNPRPGAWSAAECYVHLNLTLRAFMPSLEVALASAAPARRAPKLDLWGRLLCWMLDPRRKLKSKTSKPFAPVEAAPWPRPAQEFVDMHQKLGLLLSKSADLDLESSKVPSPFAGMVRYNLYSAFRVILVHDRRHQAQARRAAELD